MVYSPFNWRTGPAGATPITAERLNALEGGVASALPAVRVPIDASMIGGSLRFIREQLEPFVQATTLSRVAFVRSYPDDWAGRTAGVFYPTGAPATAPATLSFAGSGDVEVSSGFRGSVFGSALAGGTVRVLKVGDVAWDTGIVATIDPTTKNWSADLSTVPAWRKGEWRFQYHNASGVAVGPPVVEGRQGAYYTGLVAELRAVTDTSYLMETVAIRSDGTFDFSAAAVGTKQLRVRDTVTNAIVADRTPTTGAIRSYVVSAAQPGYGTSFVLQSYVYDQAIALSAAVVASDDDTALRLAHGLVPFARTSGVDVGGFIFSGPQHRPSIGDASFRTGAHAVALYSLLQFIQAYPQRSAPFLGTAQAALGWLEGYRVTTGVMTGLYLGGKGVYVPVEGGGQRPNLDYAIAWASTEHNIDAYWAFRLADKVFPAGGYAAKAEAVRAAIMATLWNTAENRFNQGRQPSAPDVADALDLHSWGAIFLQATGETVKAAAVMTPASLAPFAFTLDGVSGYGVADPAKGYNAMAPNVWSEGTFGVAVALRRLGEVSRLADLLEKIRPMQRPSGAWPYVLRPDPAYELNPYGSVAGAAWAVIAQLDGIWNP